MSKNEKDSLTNVLAKSPNAYWAGYGSTAPNNLPFFFAYAFSSIFFPLVMAKFLNSRGYKRKSFSYIFDHYWLIYGLYVISRIWLNRIEPKALVLSNDISIFSRVLQKAAREESVPTFYLQHASVPENLPPLAFDYALLEGYDALQTHARFGQTQTKIFLVGMPKHDAHLDQINGRANVSRVGLCTNGFDPIDRAEELFRGIRQEFPALPLILRPHNADLRIKAWKELSERYSMDFSDSSAESSFDFLGRVDAIVAGESNILLEAALMNVVPLYYDFGQAGLDWYRFRRNGLVDYASQPAELCRILKDNSQNKSSVRMKAKQYCVTVGTSYDGRASELASALIQELASNQTCLEGWKRIPNLSVEAYERS